MKFTKEKNEFFIFLAIFISIWSFLIIKANSVFLIHDEIVTKWAYMIRWNYLPYQGLIDANNHFVNSFFGGLFIRLFDSEEHWILRLPNLLSFPIFYWSLYNLKPFFNVRWNFYFFMLSLIFVCYILDFFVMARGYGISIAFLMLGITQYKVFLRDKKNKNIIISMLAWVVVVFSNLSILPLAFFTLVLFLYAIIKEKKITLLPISLFMLLPLLYALKYVFHLKAIGRLYLGDQVGFFETTIKNQTIYLWNTYHPIINLLIVLAFLFILISLLIFIRKSNKLIDEHSIFPIYLIAAIASILLQHFIFGINYPVDRAAIYLVLFFYSSLAFTFDNWHVKGTIVLSIISIVFFVYQLNTQYFMLFQKEHFDKELFTKIAPSVNGTPPVVGGMFYNIDNEMSRTYKFPVYACHDTKTKSDTIEDYIINDLIERPDILKLYHSVHCDTISGLQLFERNHFLNRTKELEQFKNYKNFDGEYLDVYSGALSVSKIVRCKTEITNLKLDDELYLVYVVEDTISKKVISYYGIAIVEGCPYEDGTLNFDVSLLLKYVSGANRANVYFYNPIKKKKNLQVNVEVFQMEK